MYIHISILLEQLRGKNYFLPNVAIRHVLRNETFIES